MCGNSRLSFFNLQPRKTARVNWLNPFFLFTWSQGQERENEMEAAAIVVKLL
jgi:hypothetical protein